MLAVCTPPQDMHATQTTVNRTMPELIISTALLRLLLCVLPLPPYHAPFALSLPPLQRGFWSSCLTLPPPPSPPPPFPPFFTPSPPAPLAGCAVYSLGVPLMLLRGEGSAPAGLVQCVQEALTRTSTTQPLVLYLPRIEVSSS